jgi:hypothetical protein
MRIETRRNLSRDIAKYLLIGVALLYAADWSVFEVRFFRGTGLGSIPVEQYLSTSLKGNKAEYDYLGISNQGCSRTLFPQYAAAQWNPPCWWLQRHRQQWR